MKKITLPVAAVIFISSGIFAQGNNSLHLKKGQKYVVENKIITKSSTELQGQAMEANADVISTYKIEVRDVVDGNYNLTNTVTAVKMNMSQMGQEMAFDSEKAEDVEGPMGGVLKDYIKQPKEVVVDKSGKVVTPSKGEKEDSLNTLARQFTNFDVTGYGADIAFESLPGDIKAGSTWTSKKERDGITKTTTYTVKSISGNLATLTLSGDIASDTKMENQGMEITTKTTGKFSGEEIVDLTSGVIQSNNSTADASGIIGVMGQELPTSSKVTSTTTVKLL